MRTVLIKILMAWSLILQPVIAFAVNDPPAAEAAAPKVQFFANPELSDVVIRLHPVKKGVLQAMKRPVDDEAPLFLDMSFDQNGMLQIQMTGGNLVSVGPQQNLIQQKLFEHSNLIQQLINNPTDETREKLSDLISPELDTISKNVLAATPELSLPAKVRLAIWSGKVAIKAFIYLSVTLMVALPVWATMAHVMSSFTLVEDIPMFLGTSFWVAVEGASYFGLKKLYKKYSNWADKKVKISRGEMLTVKKKNRAEVVSDSLKAKACNTLMLLGRAFRRPS